MSNAIVAPRTTTTGTGTTNQVQNLLTHIKSTSDAIDKGDILGSAMGVTNVALDVIGIAGDPLGAISAAGVSWVLNAVKFLREPFDILMGSPNAIASSAQSWGNAARSLSNTAQQYRQAAASQTCNWTGNAGNSYRTASTNQANGLEALARASQAVSSAMTKAGQAVAKGRQVVMDLISQAVQQIIQICIEALAASWLSFGASIAKGIAQSVQKAVSTAQKTLKKVKEVVETLQSIIKTVQQILQMVQQIKQLLQQIGGKASGQQQVQPQGQAVGYAPDSSGYYNTGAAGYSGTTQPTSTGGPGMGAAPGTPQVNPAGAQRTPTSTGGPGLGAAPMTPRTAPAGAARTPTSTGGPGLGAAPMTPRTQPAGAGHTPVSTGGPGLGAAPMTPRTQPAGAGHTPVSTGGPGVGPAPRTPQVQPGQHQHQHGPTSQNGWPVNPPRSSRTIPGTDVRVNVADGPAGDVLMHVLGQVNSRVEDISMNSERGERDDWGYAERNVRGSSDVISNHASGTAVDINATRHALGASGTFTPAQVEEIHRILAEVDNVVRWGGDYTGRLDEMHFEIVGSQEEVARVAERLRAAQQQPQ